jgi:23S rRNA pseudouridine2605 synthase
VGGGKIWQRGGPSGGGGSKGGGSGGGVGGGGVNGSGGGVDGGGGRPVSASCGLASVVGRR